VSLQNKETNEEFDFTAMFEKLKQSFLLEEATLLRILTSFTDDVREDIQDLEEACRVKNYQHIRNIAHKLAGASGNLRLDVVYKLAQEMEESASQNVDIDYLVKVEMLKTYFEQLREALQHK